MKLAIVFFMYLTSTLLAGCTTVSNHNKDSMLKFSTILNFQIGTTGQTEIINTLGEPSSFVQRDDYFVMNYNDPKTDYQKLTININKRDKKLSSLFWTPEEDEAESSLDHAKKIVDNAHYLVKEDKNISRHMVSSGILMYIDRKAGITIRYDKRRDKVEAIALYEKENRVPTYVK